METQFEVKTKLREEFLVEFFRRYLRYRIWLLVLYGVLISGWIVESIMYRSAFMLCMCAFVLAVGIWLYRRPWSVTKKIMKQEANFRNGEEQIFTVTFADRIQSVTAEGSYAIPYDKVKRIYHTRYGIVLLDIRKRFMLLDKNGFTQGTFEEFLPFILEKCPQAKTYR